MGRLIEIFLVAIVLFFAWKGAIAVTYFTSGTWNATLSNGSGLRAFLFWLFGLMQVLMIVASAGLLINTFISEKYQTESAGWLFIFTIVWAFLGWWQSGQFADGNPKLITHTLYSFATFLVAISSIRNLFVAYKKYKSYGME